MVTRNSLACGDRRANLGLPGDSDVSLHFFFFTFLAANSNGSSSPSIGGFPLPTRDRIRLTFAGSARRARSSKYSSVRIAETFSASARVISWLRATPSDSAALRASANRVGGTRKAKLLRLMNSPFLAITRFPLLIPESLPPAAPPNNENRSEEHTS